jgi:hypothetical protein
MASNSMDDQRAPPLDLFHHLSRVTKARDASSVKQFYKYFARKHVRRWNPYRYLYLTFAFLNISPRNRPTRRRLAQQPLLSLRHPRSQGSPSRSLGADSQPPYRSSLFRSPSRSVPAIRDLQQEEQVQDIKQPSRPAPRCPRSSSHPQRTKPRQEDRPCLRSPIWHRTGIPPLILLHPPIHPRPHASQLPLQRRPRSDHDLRKHRRLEQSPPSLQQRMERG